MFGLCLLTTMWSYPVPENLETTFILWNNVFSTWYVCSTHEPITPGWKSFICKDLHTISYNSTMDVGEALEALS